ncbi:MAG: DCC1-like thiol-disulfide oxidoreductase family protein [Christiangramia sp.]|nr:DCC1-like thiol-disulfide oxidoreductase family protein [Christiangramia sp.]
MFKKIEYTKYSPSKPVLIWDGDCGFCKFWKTRWQEKTEGKVDFETYQEKASDFPDIPLKEFKKASRLIESDGKVYSGPDSAYRSLWHADRKTYHEWYKKYDWFESISDYGYNHIAKNRHFYFQVTKLFFGDDPLKLKPYWLIYLLIIFSIIFII